MNSLKIDYKVLIGLLFFTALIFAINPSFAAADNIYVSTTGNDTWNGQSATYDPITGDGPKATINSAINAVDDNGTVYIASGTYNENLNVLIKNVNLIGEDPDTTIIDGQQKNGVLYFAGFDTINYYTLIISGLTLTNGKKDMGGGIYNGEGTIYLLNTKVINNIATKEGGGIYNLGTIYVDSLTEIKGNIIQGSELNEPSNVYGYPVQPLPSAIQIPIYGEEQDDIDPTAAAAVNGQSNTSSNTVPLPSTGVPLTALAFAVGLVAVGSFKGFRR
jgi:hypothetical protein